ncbi:DUF4166 domain-containing protein [Rhizobium sp. 18055]|uniref:DUF4166 domain-containing protein n=1 Tax=Rhizobium sp. 18055 TaxID=2681403 RepID=UPI0013575224|nr:DUF4166 domain-containing protein [Rhizobium sp. 18055]
MSGGQTGAATLPLYRRLLGPEWDGLPPAVAAMHDVTGTFTASGQAEIQRGAGLLAWMAAALSGFPETAAQTDITVHFSSLNGVETWTRRFGGKVFRSRQCAGSGKHGHLLAEDLGPFRILTKLVVRDGRLVLDVRGWRLLGLPLPLMLAPGGLIFEEERGGRFHFHVEVRAPLIGLIVRYTGWLVPDTMPGAG